MTKEDSVIAEVKIAPPDCVSFNVGEDEASLGPGNFFEGDKR